MVTELAFEDDQNLCRKSALKRCLSNLYSAKKTVYPAYYSLTKAVIPCLINCRLYIQEIHGPECISFVEKNKTKTTLRKDVNWKTYSAEVKSWSAACFYMVHSSRMVFTFFTCLKKIKRIVIFCDL